MMIELLENKGILKSPLSGELLDKIREMPGRKRWYGRELHFELTRANLEYLRKTFPHAVFNDQNKRLDEIDEIAMLEADSIDVKYKQSKIEIPPESLAFPFKTVPRQKQMEAFQWARDRDYFALFMEMGTGKTKVSLDLAADWWAKGFIDGFLILAPNGVHEQWTKEQIPTHLPEFVNHIDHTYTSGKKIPNHMFERGERLRILSMNIEALSHKSGFDNARRFVLSGKILVIVDESTDIKTPGSQRTKNVIHLRDISAKRGILSGAPITRGLEDLYSQFMFLDEDILGFSSFYSFRARYCDVEPAYFGAPRGAVKIVAYRNTDEFTKKVEAHSFRATKEECLDLPPKIYLERIVQLTDDQKALYKQMKDELFVQVDSGIVSAPNAVAKLMRLQQITCGHLPNEEGKIVRIKNNRMAEVLGWLEQVRGKFVIWARFIEDINILTEGLAKAGYRVARYDGMVPRADRLAGEEWFKHGDADGMVANAAATARGKNWQMASYVGYYSNSFNADHRWQSEDRTHRDGMGDDPCVYTEFISPGTVDRYILSNLKDKKNIADAVLDKRSLLEALAA